MKLTNKELVDSTNVLSRLTGMDLNIRVSYAVAKNINKIQKELKIYDAERSKLLDKYAVKDEEGELKIDDNGNLTIKEDCLDDWNKDCNELSNIEIEVDIHQINPEHLEKCNCSITPGELMIIGYMFN